MRLLVIGVGAREHALVARLLHDPDVNDVLGAPGNPGIAALTRTVPLDLSRPDAALAIAARERVETLTTCSACGKETTVPFKPTQGRPVFCKECFQSRKFAGAGSV